MFFALRRIFTRHTVIINRNRVRFEKYIDKNYRLKYNNI